MFLQLSFKFFSIFLQLSFNFLTNFFNLSYDCNICNMSHQLVAELGSAQLQLVSSYIKQIIMLANLEFCRIYSAKEGPKDIFGAFHTPTIDFNRSMMCIRDAFKKKKVNFGTSAQKGGRGQSQIPNVDQY